MGVDHSDPIRYRVGKFTAGVVRFRRVGCRPQTPSGRCSLAPSQDASWPHDQAILATLRGISCDELCDVLQSLVEIARRTCRSDLHVAVLGQRRCRRELRLGREDRRAVRRIDGPLEEKPGPLDGVQVARPRQRYSPRSAAKRLDTFAALPHCDFFHSTAHCRRVHIGSSTRRVPMCAEP